LAGAVSSAGFLGRDMDSSPATVRTDTVRTLGLAEWLDAQACAPGPMAVLGITGHLDLSAAEQTQIERALADALAPLAALPAHVEIVLLTGLAPGTDLVLAEAVTAWMSRHGRLGRHVGLLPVPVEVLWNDWLPRSGVVDATFLEQVRARFDQNIASCDSLIRLWHQGEPRDWTDVAERQLQYRRLAAVLAEQSDVLIAVLRPSRGGQPGGTWEVANWREHRETIPAALSSGPRRHRSGWPHGDRLMLINPTPGHASPPTEKSWLVRAREALRSGNYLLCHDLTVKASQQGAWSHELEYLRLQALTNAGSTHAALRRFGELPAELRESSEDWLALAGRLHKELGLLGGKDSTGHFRHASSIYAAAFRRTGGTFSAINAATTALFGGDPAGARALAAGVLERLRTAAPVDESASYYAAATEAEAALLLGDAVRARAALARADTLLVGDTNARSRTRRQLRRICRELALDDRLLEVLRLPPVVHVTPGSDESIPPTALAYAGITTPQELEGAERALTQGARLHAVLAAPPETMLAHWGQAHGPAWTTRLRRLLEQAHERSVALGFLPAEDQWCDAYVGAMALGLSRLAARRLDCSWQGLSTDADAGAPGTTIEAAGISFTRRFAGVIFADFAGFSRLSDAELPQFWALFMRAISVRLATRRGEILLKQTWGDALHLVAKTARAAAELACEIQSCVEELRPSLPGTLSRLELRLAAHFAPVFAGHDPVEGAGTYFGTQLSFTARIEPVTPPGMIFVTEAFAAQLALEAPDAFTLEYAGEVTLAKAYGQSRLFSLRPVTS